MDAAAHLLDLGDVTTSMIASPAFDDGVSVVLPAHGVRDTLPGALQAVCTAAEHLPTGTPWECWVIDDASDPPLSLPEGLPPEVRLVRTERQVFCGGARNVGLARARYGLTVFCDADTHLAPGYLTEHCLRHLLAPNLVTISLREHVPAGTSLPARTPHTEHDSRVHAHYTPDRLGLVRISEALTVQPLACTRHFRDFGYGRVLGPVGLPFMVKGNNLALATDTARAIGGFPPDFTGWGPEDVCFAAKCVARGAFVVPVLSTGVFHLDHPPRSGSRQQRDAELRANLNRYDRHLDRPADGPWTHAEVAA